MDTQQPQGDTKAQGEPSSYGQLRLPSIQLPKGGGAIRLGEDITNAAGRHTIRYDLSPEVTSIHLRAAALDEDGKP